jgi:Protein of unknown function (DUF3102)
MQSSRPGRLLIEAKEALDHGEFIATVETELPFGPRTAQMLMKISSDARLVNTNHSSLLSPSWRTLYEITKLGDDAFDENIGDGTINPEGSAKISHTKAD